MMRRALAVVVSVASTGLIAGCPPPRPAPIEPIKVGVLNPISGSLSSLGPSWENAARLAAEEVNAGGGVFDGRPLELVFKDSGTNPALAVEAAQELVDQGVVGLIGPATSGESGAVLDIVEAAEIPMISCCATAADLTTQQVGNNGFFFRTTPSDELQGKAIAFLAKDGFDGATVDVPACEKAAFVHRNDAYGEGFKAEFSDAYVGVGEDVDEKIPVVRFYGTPDAEASQDEIETVGEDAATAINGLLQAGVDNGELCIVVISFDIDGAPLIVSLDGALQDLLAARAGDPDFAFSYHYLVGDGANSSAFAGIVGALGSKIFGTVPFHATNDAYDRFSNAFQARYELDTEPIAFTSQNYDAVFVMALAITQAKSTVGKDIRNKLYTVSGSNGGARFEGAFFGEVADALLKGDQIDYVGPSGELTFSPVGDVVGDYVVWQVDNVDGDFRVVEREPLLASDFNP